MNLKVSSKDFLSPSYYSVFILTLPKVNKKELKQIVLYKLKGIYPGNINNVNLHILKNGSKKNSYIILLVDKKYNDDENLSFILLMNNIKKIKTNKLTFIGNDYIESIFIKNKSIEKYNVEFIESINVEKANILFDDSNDKEISTNKNLSTIRDFYKSNRNKKIFFGILILIVFVFFNIILFHSYKDNANKLIEQRKEIQKKTEKQKILKDKEIKLDKLKNDFFILTKNKNEKIIKIIDCIVNNLTSETKILNLEINNNNFFFTASSFDSLKILNNFEVNKNIKKAILHQVTIEKNFETYSISGEMIKNFETPNDTSNIDEQILWYKNKILEIESKNNVIKDISNSSLIDYLRNTILNYNSNIDSYQILQNKNQNEIEFIFSVNSINLFRLLSLLSSDYQLFDISQLSIRKNEFSSLSVVLKLLSLNDNFNSIPYSEVIDINNIVYEDLSNKISNFFTFKNKQEKKN